MCRRHRHDDGLPGYDSSARRLPARATHAIGGQPDMHSEGRSIQMNAAIIRWLLAVSLSVVLILGLAATASAHEHREVGDYELTVGFTGEPALINEPNGLDLRVQLGHGDDGTPVEGLQETLQAEISYAGERRSRWNSAPASASRGRTPPTSSQPLKAPTPSISSARLKTPMSMNRSPAVRKPLAKSSRSTRSPSRPS